MKNIGKQKQLKSTVRSNSNSKSKRFSTNHDPFFKQDAKRRRKEKKKFEEGDGYIDDEVIDSDESEGGDYYSDGGANGGMLEDKEEDEFEKETANERRLRLAKQHLEHIRSITEREEGEDSESGSDREEREIDKDALVAKILQNQQLEESGRVRRLIASKVQKPETDEAAKFLVKHRQSVTAVALSHDDLRGFSASKDGAIFHWDVETGKHEKYLWPNDELLKSHGLKHPQGRAVRHSKQVLALAVSSDGRYLASGGVDRHVHLWDARTRMHIKALPGHRGSVSCLSFRQGTSELFSGSFDCTVKIWNAEDKAYMTTLVGHNNEVLSIDCLRKERALTIGRDRTMRLWKVPEESQLVFRGPAASLECGCFVSDDVFLSGSDDGNIELWGIQRKKPISIVKNGHALPSAWKLASSNGTIPNGHTAVDDERKAENPCSTAHSWVGSVAACLNSDLAATGAGNGFVHLWGIESENRGIRPLFNFPLTGFVNSLAFAKSGKFLVAGVGQEPRLGRWGQVPNARNGVALQSFRLS